MATFLQLQTEFLARGYQYLLTGAGLTRAKAWLNQSYLEVCEEEPWPFLLATAAGASPVTVTDVRVIRSVTDTTQRVPLEVISEDDLLGSSLLLTTAGPPTYYYLDDVIVRTYPVGGTLSIRYYKVPAELVADADVAIVPNRFADLIVNGAVRRAALDANEAAGAAEAEGERQRGLALMRRSLLNRDGLLDMLHSSYSACDG